MWLQRGASKPGQDSGALIEKIYVFGSMAEAEHECTMGRLAAGPGVVHYERAATNTASNRPSVILQFADGQNLSAIVAQCGAIPAADALTTLASVAQTIDRLHSLRTTSLPMGMCHSDVKPQNILMTDAGTLLLDFEHACAIGTRRETTFTGGTSAYSAPEAHVGKQPNEAFDVFGLGATLAFLLDGGTVRRLPRHPDVDALIMDCCAPEPSNRPTAKEVTTRCERLANALRCDPAEIDLQDWASGTCQHEATEHNDARSALWSHRHRLLKRLPGLLTPSDALPSNPDELQQQLDLTLRVLDRFPRNQRILAKRQQLLHAIRTLLQSSATTVRQFNKAEQFNEALHWLRTAEALTITATSQADGLTQISKLEKGQAPSALQRAPIEFLQLLADQTQGAQEKLQQRTDEISAAEQGLDLVRVEQSIDVMAAEYGGTSKTVAQHRDQLHRLSFYLDRITRSETKVGHVGPLWNKEELEPLRVLVAAASNAIETTTRRETAGSGTVGLRSLQVTLANIVNEFPHLTQVPPALEVLSRALTELTDQAWQQLNAAEQRLTIVPVPVRPLQLALGRLDTFRMLEVFIDREGQPRGELLDGIERLRIGLEQARSARDRLAENAEHELARGHWTTGLFDMERAVERLNPGDESERAEADRLRERLQAARRTKQEIETAVRRNVELATSYTALEDDAMSTSDARLKVLLERRDCLIFLGLHLPNDRKDLYRNDLRGVEIQLAVERAADAERRLDAQVDPAQRLRLARNTIESLSAISSTSDAGIEQSGRLVRLQEHWRTVVTQCQRSVDLLLQQEQHKLHQRRRLLAIAALALIATTTALIFAFKPWLISEPGVTGEKQTNGPNDNSK